MRLPSKFWMSVMAVSLSLLGAAQPGMAQPSWGGLPFDGLPDGAQLQAGGTTFFGLAIPMRTVYVGEAVPVDIQVGLRQGLTATLKGLPLLKGSGFTLNKLTKQTDTRKTYIGGKFFDVLMWHTAISAVKPGKFSLSAGMPLSAKISVSTTVHGTVTSRTVSKDIVIGSAPVRVNVLPLPLAGRPQGFSGAVGDFQVSSDISATSVKAGEPLTVHLYVKGQGNFERVDSTMIAHLDHWKTYPAKAVFTPSDAVGNKGQKLFEQSLIATAPGEQSIPGFDFIFFNPSKGRYEHARTSSFKVTVAAALLGALPVRAVTQRVASVAPAGIPPGLRPDHRAARAGQLETPGELRPLYFQAPFLLLLAFLALLLPGAWVAARPNPTRATARATRRALARLERAAQADDKLSFLELARNTLLQTLAARWQMAAEHITDTELRARLGAAGPDIQLLFAAADETKYAGSGGGGVDLQHWLGVIRRQLVVERG